MPETQAPAGRLNFFHPANLIATCAGIGNLPKAPGTWGSAAALPAAWAIAAVTGRIGLTVAIILVFAAGVWASSVYCRRNGVHDPGSVVIDEVAGQWITLLVVPPDFLLYGLGFVLFRAADILKPWPISWADRRIGGGFGVMFDDVLAGILAAIILFALALFMGGN